MTIGMQKEIDNHPQSQDSGVIQYYLMTEEKTDILLTSVANTDVETLNVSPGHGFSIGDHVVLWENDVFAQIKITNVVSNAISLKIPLANNFSVNAQVIRGNIEMNVDASGGDIDYIFRQFNSIMPFDITTIVLTLQHAGGPDDGKFGGIAALINGLFFRKNSNLGNANYGVYSINQDFRDIGAEVIYTDKGPAGINATNIMIKVEDVFGQVIRINPRATHQESIFARLRDKIDVAAGISKFTTSILASTTRGE